MDNDPILLARIANGDENAFRQIYIQFYQRLFYLAFAMVRTRESAEEIVEDVFVRIWQHREGAATIRNLRLYLYTATRNSALNYLAQKSRRSITEFFGHIDIELDSSAGTPE